MVHETEIENVPKGAKVKQKNSTEAAGTSILSSATALQCTAYMRRADIRSIYEALCGCYSGGRTGQALGKEIGTPRYWNPLEHHVEH
jgi:hypothetical protein